MDTDPDAWIINPFLDEPVSFSDQEKCCLFLIEHGANVNLHKDEVNRETLLHQAISNDFNRIAEALMKAGAEINSTNGNVFTKGMTPLHLAYKTITLRLIGSGSLSLFAVVETSEQTQNSACSDHGYGSQLRLKIFPHKKYVS